MRIAILSRNKGLHSIRRLLQEARKARIQCDIINPVECQLIVDGKNSQIHYRFPNVAQAGGPAIPKYDAILPRIGASVTDYGLAVVKQFEALGVRTINGSSAIAHSRDKMRCLQVLTQAGIQVPPTVLTRSSRNLRAAVDSVKGMPVVLKLLEGTQGVGVMIVHTPISLGSVMETLRGLGQDVILQQFIAEGAGRDYRAFVVGGKVIAAMMRTAPEGEFRSNIHRGGQGKLVRLPPSYERAALRATSALGLHIAGVDIMESNSGPMVIEVNSSPGFEGIEKATGLNIAAVIVKHIMGVVRRDGKKRRRAAVGGRAANGAGKRGVGAVGKRGVGAVGKRGAGAVGKRGAGAAKRP